MLKKKSQTINPSEILKQKVQITHRKKQGKKTKFKDREEQKNKKLNGRQIPTCQQLH